jgi:hypothetical protein
VHKNQFYSIALCVDLKNFSHLQKKILGMSLSTLKVLHFITIIPTVSESCVLTVVCQLTGTYDSEVCRQKHKNSLHLFITLKVGSFVNFFPNSTSWSLTARQSKILKYLAIS